MSEYLLYIHGGDIREAQDEINRLAREGWRVVTAFDRWLVLEREAQQEELSRFRTFALDLPGFPMVSFKPVEGGIEFTPPRGIERFRLSKDILRAMLDTAENWR